MAISALETLKRYSAIFAILLFAWVIWTQREQFAAALARLDVPVAAVAIVLAVPLCFLWSEGWRRILLAMGAEISASASARIWIVSSVSRYIPGGIWSYLSRGLMASEAGLRTETVVLSMYVETLLIASSSLAVGLGVFTASAQTTIPPWSALIVLAVSGLLLHPCALRQLARIPGPIGRIAREARVPPGRSIWWLFVLYCGCWLLWGVAFAVLAHAVAGFSLTQALAIGSSFVLAYFVGYVTFIVPGGAGVREGALFVLLTASLPEGQSLLLATASRLWLIACELIAFCAVLPIRIRVSTVEAQRPRL